MLKALRGTCLALLATPWIAACTGGPAFPNLGILKRQSNATLTEAEQQQAISELEAAQENHEKNAEREIERR